MAGRVQEILQRNMPGRPRHLIGGPKVRQEFPATRSRQDEETGAGTGQTTARHQAADQHIGAYKRNREAEGSHRALGPGEQVLDHTAPESGELRDLIRANWSQEQAKEERFLSGAESCCTIGELAQERPAPAWGGLIVEKPFQEAQVFRRGAALPRLQGPLGAPEERGCAVLLAADSGTGGEGKETGDEPLKGLLPGQATGGQEASASTRAGGLPLSAGRT
jgi:hypothetical protein